MPLEASRSVAASKLYLNRNKVVPDWENCGGPAKRIKREDSEEQRSILQMIGKMFIHFGYQYSLGTSRP